jgi:hypothetical protein
MAEMEIIDWFNSDLLELPRNRSCEDFEAFLRDWFAEFRGSIESLTDGGWVTAQLKNQQPLIGLLCDEILGAVGWHLNGFPHRAYDSISHAMEAIKPWMDPLATIGDISGQLELLYRVRIGGLTDFTRGELFHIPFEKRILVKPQRYSISGLPSLYLGGSIWVCWEELGRPRFEEMQISRFRAVPKSNIKLVDLGFRPAMIAAFMASHPMNFTNANRSAKFILAHAIC